MAVLHNGFVPSPGSDRSQLPMIGFVTGFGGSFLLWLALACSAWLLLAP